jgi:AcrR family transcriptional regulator
MASRGRPRSFSREQALERALELFWARGYEGATLSDLQEAMGGITAPSFYAAFGSKEGLFREVVELYSATQGAPMVTNLTQGTTARASIEGLLRAALAAFFQRNCPRGCLLVLSAVNCMPENHGVQEYMRQQRALRHKLIRKRLERGVTEGDVPDGTDLTAVATFYTTIVDGLALQARDSVSQKALRFVIDAAMAAWPELVRKDQVTSSRS